MALRLCPAPHCSRFVAPGAKYCSGHARERDAARGSAQERGYDRAWATVSRDWLRRYPICGQRLDGRLYPEHSRCVQRSERVAATVVDHIVALVDGGDKFNPNNFQSLCNACNVRKAFATKKSPV